MTHNIILNFMDGDSYKYHTQSNTDTIETLLNNAMTSINNSHLIYSVFKEGDEDKLHYNTLLYTLFDQSNNNTPLVLFGLGENITEDIFNEYQNLYKQLKNDNHLKTFTDIQNATFMKIRPIYLTSRLFNGMIDAYPIRYLHNIKTITIENCNIKNLSSLGYCNNLTELTISGYTNINDLSGLNNIEHLTIHNCDIADIYSTNVLSRLLTLRITGCFNITRLSLLKFTPNLTILRINNCNLLHDISQVTNLSKLYSLELMSSNKITDLSCIKDLLQLNNLAITRCGITDISVLKYTPHILGLILKSIEIKDLSSLQYLTILKELRLQYCRDITDISVLKSLNNLEHLYVHRCKNVENISVLETLSKDVHIHKC